MRCSPYRSATIFLAGLLIELAACGGAVPADGGASGIDGQAMQGPVCPGPVRLDTPCPDRPIQARIDVRDGSGTSVVEVQTDAQGGFHAVLPAGSYTLVPRTPGGITHAPEQTVVVQPGQFTHVVVTYDTGMR